MGVVTQCSVLIAAICVIYLLALYGAIKYGVVTQCSVLIAAICVIYLMALYVEQ